MNNSSATSTPKRPGWAISALIIAVVVAIVWALGVTVFRAELQDRGLPEEIRGSTAEEFAGWRLGATMADLAARAQVLAAGADDESAAELLALNESLGQAAALLGELRSADTPPVHTAQYSAAAAQGLAREVLALNQRPLDDLPTDPATKTLVVRIAFETSLDARSVLLAIEPDTETAGVVPPLAAADPSQTVDEATAGPLTCLATTDALQPDAVPAAEDSATVRAARALDRGYALDYVLQLQAARGAAAAAPALEAERLELNQQLEAIRSVFAQDCADLRQLAYNLPEGSLQALPDLAAELQRDLRNELLVAISLTDGTARTTLAEVLWQRLSEEQDRGDPADLLSAS